MNRTLMLAVLLPFSVLSAWSLVEVGYIGIFTGQMHPGGYQVFADLCISLSIVSWFMWHDAQATGRNPWPFMLLILPLGSFGPLLYWLLAPRSGKPMAAMG